MAKRRKNRTHLKGQVQREEVASNVPKSFIIKHGQVGSSINQLVRDMRKVMEPHTASRLKERNRNKLKDYITMGPALQVTHLLAFRLTPIAPSLKIIRLSDGPTLTFRVERYSLMKDILKSSRRAKSIGMEYLTPPLLVLANFPQPGPGTPQHLPLLMKSFQTLFPPLSPHTITLSSARRVVLVSYNAERGTVDFRHYLIRVKAYGVSKRVRRILEGASTSTKPVVNLGSEKDVADFLLRQRGMPGPDGYESASSAESEAGDHNTVELGSDYVGRNNKKGQKRAVRLDEVGPRLELRLVKITEGIPGKEGNVIYHEFVKKSKKEVAEQKANIAAKEKLRKERREEQERNVACKKAEADAKKKGKKKAGEEDEGEEEDEEMEDDHEMSDEEAASDGDAEEADDDDEWDDEEEITDGEDEEDEGLSEEENSESEDEAPPPKKPKFHKKR